MREDAAEQRVGIAERPSHTEDFAAARSFTTYDSCPRYTWAMIDKSDRRHGAAAFMSSSRRTGEPLTRRQPADYLDPAAAEIAPDGHWTQRASTILDDDRIAVGG